MGSHGVLSLHLGVRTGWAYGAGGEARPTFGTWRLSEGTDHAEIGCAFMDALADHRKLLNPAVIAITTGIGDPETADQANAAVIRIKLAGLAEVFAWRRSIRLAIVNPELIRDQVLGPTGNHPIDVLVSTWARRQGWEAKHPSAAHALVLWHHAVTAIQN